MSKAQFVYVVYIETTQEKAWQALVQGDVTRKYWGYENVSDWKVGSRWEHKEGATGQVKLVGDVLETNPPKRLVMSWADPSEAADKSKHSRVTFDLEPVGSMLRLTVTHEDLEVGSKMLKGITEGWPRVLSSMKTFLETGKALETWVVAKH